MPFLLSWLDFFIKLALLVIFTAGCWAYGRKRVDKDFPFPLFLAAALPFFIAYKVLVALGKGSILPEVYTAIAVLGGVLFVILTSQKLRVSKSIFQSLLSLLRQHQAFVYLLIGILIFFCLRGLYLEYPGDAIDYLKRLGQANRDGASSLSSLWAYSSVNTFFASFQQWLAGTDYLLRAKLRLVAAISAGILCIATYRLALWSTRHQTSSLLAVLLFLGFYGNLQISFFLYKILQGATLAMIIYLEVVPFLYSVLSTTKPKQLFSSDKLPSLLVVVLGTWMCLDCHQEKVLYLFAIAFSYAFWVIVKQASARKRPPILPVFIFILLSVFLIDSSLSENPPLGGYYLPLIKEWFIWGSHTLFTYWPIASNSAVLLLDTVAIGLSILLLTGYHARSREFFMAAIAIAPFFFFINPIAITGLIKITSANNIYRLMIGGLPWIFLPLACNTLQRDHSLKLRYVPIIFVLLGLLAYGPIYGKFPHLLKQIPAYADGRDLAPVVKYLLNKSQQNSQPYLNITAPPYVSSYLSAWPNFQTSTSRWIITELNLSTDLAYLFGSEITDQEITDIINSQAPDVIIIDHRDGLSYQSWLGRMTQHWPPDLIATQQAMLAGIALRSYLENQPQPLFEKVLEENGFQVYQRIDPGQVGSQN